MLKNNEPKTCPIPKLKFVRISYGGGCAIGVSGPSKKVSQILNQLYNVGCTNAEPVRDTPNFGYFSSSEHRIKCGLAYIKIIQKTLGTMALESDRDLNKSKIRKDKRKDIWKEANDFANQIWESMEIENFIPSERGKKIYKWWGPEDPMKNEQFFDLGAAKKVDNVFCGIEQIKS